MADSLTIAVLQRTITPHDPAGNLLGILDMLRACARQQVELFVLTELWSTGILDIGDGSAADLAEDLTGPTVEALSGFCMEAQAYMLAGTLPLRQGGKLRDVALMIDPSGKVILQYAKTQLFSPMGEDEVFTAGDHLAAVKVNGVGVGVLICYELRFPSLARALAKSGCEVILVPALWPQERIEHWETLTRARAIENQIFMVGANGIMNQDDVFVPGRSLIVGPNGDTLNTPEMRETTIVRTVNVAQARELRSRISYINEERDIREVKW